MKTTDNLVPYLLMGMHPLQHITMLVAGTVLLTTRYDLFFEIEGTCPPGEAEDFRVDGKYTLMTYAMTAHGMALFLHWMYQILHHFEIKVLANLCLVTKMLVFFVLILKIQSSIDFTECAVELSRSQVMAWLTYEVLLFYLNIVSMCAFIFIQNCK